MDPIARMVAAGAAGAAGGDPTYVDDVFSTFLYTGTGSGASSPSAQSINNGIDLSGEGGLVWIKNRDYAYFHCLWDTSRGPQEYLKSNTTDAETLHTGGLTSFNSDGFTLGVMPQVNEGTTNYEDFVSWSFRKAPGFFDVVSYTGSGSAQNIAHNLGSVPGMMLIKRTDSTGYWYVYHRNLGNQDAIILNASDNKFGTSVFNNTTPTSSVFTVAGGLSTDGGSYVAYLFAHDDQSFGTNNDEAIIKCGNYSGNSSEVEVNLGFEPQWLLFKCSSSTSSSWSMVDNMRGLSDQATPRLRANLSNAEQTASPAAVKITSTGFIVTNTDSDYNTSGQTFIYMAIRRPHKPPTAGTEVFNVKYLANGSTNLGFVADTNISKYPNGTQEWYWNSRLTGNKDLNSNNAGTEDTAQPTYWDLPTNTVNYGSYTGYHVNYVFRRAPGFFDVVAYTGTGSARTVNHNLQSVPEMIIVKDRSRYEDWQVYHHNLNSSYGSSYPASELVHTLNADSVTYRNVSVWNSTTPTSSVFSLGSSSNTNHSGDNYIAYLFASLDGISKVGTYSGNTGYDVNVDCGFTAGARFVMIKRTDSSGNWYVWDTARGIVSGNDPYSLLNTTDAQVTNTDYIDPLNAGFTVTSSAPAAINASGGTYLFLAIA